MLLLWLILLSSQIIAAGRAPPPRRADAAIVLGAAVVGAAPSPVFEERIKHAVELHRAGQVRTLIFTGGLGTGERHAESTVGQRYALGLGVPAQDIATETRSRTTHGNLYEARRIIRARRLRSAVIVSDPLHLKRALKMGRDLGIQASGSPTPTTRYRTWRTKSGFLLRELYFYHHYLVTGA